MRYGSCQKPHRRASHKINDPERLHRHLAVEIKSDSREDEHREGVGNQVAPTAMHQRPGENTAQTPHPPRHDAIHPGIETRYILIKMDEPQHGDDQCREAQALHKMSPRDFEAVMIAVHEGNSLEKLLRGV